MRALRHGRWRQTRGGLIAVRDLPTTRGDRGLVQGAVNAGSGYAQEEWKIDAVSCATGDIRGAVVGTAEIGRKDRRRHGRPGEGARGGARGRNRIRAMFSARGAPGARASAGSALTLSLGLSAAIFGFRAGRW